MKNEILKNKSYLLLSFITSIYILIPHLLYGRNTKILLFFVFLFFLLSKINRLVFGLFSFIIMIFNILFIHVYFHWGGAFGHNVVVRIETAQMSPSDEIFEYLKNYLSMVDALMIVYLLVGMYLIYKLFKYEHSLRKIKLLALVIFPILLIFIIVYRDPFVKVAPFNYVYKYIEAGKWKEIVQKRKEYLHKYKNTTEVQNIDYDKILIILGESASKSHMSLYGYSLKTTPFFDSLKQKKGFYRFNAISPANQTLYAVTSELTDANVTNFYDNFVHSISIVTKFKNYGFDTYWLSNQSTHGGVESYIVSIANEANHIKILNHINWKSLTKLDDKLIEYYNTIKPKQQKEAYFFHLLGSHVDYIQRIDKKHVLFEKPKDIIEEYDNSIFYTDYILNNILNRFKNEKILFVYFSDHGEVVSLKKHGHNFSPSYKDEYDIPFIIYSSIDNKKLNKLYELNKNKVFNLESLPNMIDYILGINDDLSKISTKKDILLMEPRDKLELRNNNYDSLLYYK